MEGRSNKSKGGRAPSKTEALLARVIKAGGTLDVSLTDGVNYAALMASANLFKVPAGKQLVWADRFGKHSSHPQIRLEDVPAWVNAVLEPIPVPAKLEGLHPAVADLLAGKAHFDRVAAGRRPLAVRLLQGLVTEAVRRGYSATSGALERNYRHRAVSQQQIHLTVTILGHHFYVGVDDDWRSRYPNEQEKRRRDREVGPVRLQMINGHEHRSSLWTLDLTDERVGVVLAQVLQELELRAQVAEEGRQERLAEDRKRQQRRDAVMAQARERYFEDQRAKALVTQVEQWELTQRIDSYLAALEAALPECGSPEELTGWIAWARAYQQRIDPFHAGIKLSGDEDPAPEQLIPYLPSGWSPYASR